MSPSLCDTDIVVFRRIWFNEDLRGKVVVAGPDDDLIVKRVLAWGGDKFRIARGSSLRNEVPVAEPYVCHNENNILINWPLENSAGEPQAILIPKEFVFLLGDNRTESNDSRSSGMIREDAIRGVMVAQFHRRPQHNSCSCVEPPRLALNEPR